MTVIPHQNKKFKENTEKEYIFNLKFSLSISKIGFKSFYRPLGDNHRMYKTIQTQPFRKSNATISDYLNNANEVLKDFNYELYLIIRILRK